MSGHILPALPDLGLLRRSTARAAYSTKDTNPKAEPRRRCWRLGISGRQRRLLRQLVKRVDMGYASRHDMAMLAHNQQIIEEAFNRGDISDLFRGLQRRHV